MFSTHKNHRKVQCSSVVLGWMNNLQDQEFLHSLSLFRGVLPLIVYALETQRVSTVCSGPGVKSFVVFISCLPLKVTPWFERFIAVLYEPGPIELYRG